MRVLVTGAQGCIGAWTVKLLLDRGVDVVSFDMDEGTARLTLIASEDQVRRLRRETGKIEDTARVKALIRDEGITHIVHLAAVLMPFCQAQPVAGGMIDVIGTLNVFEGARDAGRAVRVVYASSSAVWGPGELYGDRPLSEEEPLKPATHYGVFKQTNESNARVFHSLNGISSMGLRPWTVYGPGRDRGLTAAPTFAMKAAVLGKPFRIGVTGYMDLQYVEDVAESFIRCVLSDLEGAHVFNLVGDVVRMDDLIQKLDRLRPGAAGLITSEGPQVPVAYRMDGSQLHARVPGIPKTDLETGMRKTIQIFERLQGEGRLTPDLA